VAQQNITVTPFSLEPAFHPGANRRFRGQSYFALQAQLGHFQCVVYRTYAELASFHSGVIAPLCTGLGGRTGVLRFPPEQELFAEARAGQLKPPLFAKYLAAVSTAVVAARFANNNAYRAAEERLVHVTDSTERARLQWVANK